MPELMTNRDSHKAYLKRLYPDLIARSGLAETVRSALSDIRSALPVSELDSLTFRALYARVAMGSRFSQVYIAAYERLFIFDFWNRGVMLATGRTDDVHEMARAIDRWVASDCRSVELAAEFDWIQVEPAAPSFDRGEEVEYRWLLYLESLPEGSPN